MKELSKFVEESKGTKEPASVRKIQNMTIQPVDLFPMSDTEAIRSQHDTQNLGFAWLNPRGNQTQRRPKIAVTPV